MKYKFCGVEQLLYLILEVGKEVQSRLGIWRNKLTEIEQKYEELHADLNSQPKRGKNKTKAKAKANADSNCSQLAEYAARLVFHFLSKVRSFNYLQLFKVFLLIIRTTPPPKKNILTD